VVITTRKEESLISDLAETFDNLNRYKLKLNPTKYSFGVSAGQLLGFLVFARGIEANPEKIQAILTMGKPTKLHDVQKLAGRGPVYFVSEVLSPTKQRYPHYQKLTYSVFTTARKLW
jgi:hypothetical protein